VSETGQDGQQGSPQAASVLKLADAMLRTALVPGLVTAAAGTVVAALLVGQPGLYGGLLGGLLAFASSLATIVMMRFSADLPAALVMAIALGGYLFKLIALLVAMILIRDIIGTAAVHPVSLALTFLATVMVWAVAELIAFKRTRLPVLIVD
jgi:ATP synthase protein I